jgi:hypothetical protein
MSNSENSVSPDADGVSRRGVLKGAAGIGAVVSAGGLLDVGVLEQSALAAPDPGTVAQPAPTLAFSDRPITAENRGRLVRLPEPESLSLKEVRFGPRSVSFTEPVRGLARLCARTRETGSVMPRTRSARRH